MASRSIWFAVSVLTACAATDDIEPMSAGSSDSTAASPSEGSSSRGPEMTTMMMGDSSGDPVDSTSTDDGSDGMLRPDVPNPDAGLFASGTFVIPAGTVVEEFSFTSTADFSPGILDGRTLVVAVTDLSHPDRDQDVLCPGSHPLDGCATVDYGAFGNTHDNRISFEGAEGPLSIHLYKDRSLQAEAEPLPPNE